MPNFPLIRRRILPTLLFCASLPGLWLGLQTKKPDSIHPAASSRQRWNAYDDRSKGGSSRCEVFAARDTLRAAIRTGPSPDAYWGIEWEPTPQGHSSLSQWSWKSRDSLIFLWKARHATQQRIFLCSYDPAMTSPSDPLSRRYLTADLPIDREWSRSAISLSDLEPPAWWLALRPGLPHPRKPFLRSVLALQIGPSSGMVGVDDTIEIASIEHKSGTNVPLLAVLSCLGLLGGLILAFLPRPRTAPEAAATHPAITPLEPRSLVTPPPDLERLNHFLADNYCREDLDLATVATELALPLRRITNLLNGNGESFKATLNRLRLQEARRLLLETDLQVSEIAFKVGYGNVSHFNRVFRERFETAPGALRAALQNPSNPVQNLQTGESDKDPNEIN